MRNFTVSLLVILAILNCPKDSQKMMKRLNTGTHNYIFLSFKDKVNGRIGFTQTPKFRILRKAGVGPLQGARHDSESRRDP